LASAHLVQLYDHGDARALTENVAEYVCESVRRGAGAIVIATAPHAVAFAGAIEARGIDVEHAVRASRLVVLDAEQTLARFMVDGQPDWERFEAAVAPQLRRVGESCGGRGLRAYGEMVGVLWDEGKFAAAIQLEAFWNRLLADGGFELFCAYPIDVCGDGFHDADVDAMLCSHTHVVAGDDGALARALHRAMDEVLGWGADGVRRLVDAHHRPAWAALPDAEAAILWLRKNLPDYAGEILARAQRYRAAA
jgi:DcmR-like sensory protein